MEEARVVKKRSKEAETPMSKYEAEAAAKLRAQLDLVETRNAPGHSRRPRKIGVMTCDTGIKTGYRTATVDFVLRLDHNGTFIAEHGDVWYCSSSREALKAKMDQVAKVTLDLEWTRYLLVKYEAVVRSDRWGGYTHLDLDAERSKKTVVLGMTLTWETVEYSGAIELPGQGTRYMRREVNDGKPGESQTTEKELPDGLIPYSDHREGVLKKLREALAQVDRRMVELFRGVPADVGRRIDSLGASGVRLLDAPKEPHRPAMPKRATTKTS
jgi:hypothetical protein